MAKYILDISHHQEPSKIHYDKLAKELDFVIIRTQYGSNTVDRQYKTHHAEFKKRGVPRHAYAWVRGVSVSDMQVEAFDFYYRTKELNPEVWWLDVEEKSMSDMRGGVKAYAKRLRELGAKKVGVYIAHHLYKDFNIDLSDFDAVWIPRYGLNKPDYPCDLWQYTEKGNLPGYSGTLDLNKLNGKKPLEWFLGAEKKAEKKATPYPGELIKEGSRGKNVGEVQKKVGSKADDIFGPKTKAAVKVWQKKNGLVADGIVGPMTWKKMF